MHKKEIEIGLKKKSSNRCGEKSRKKRRSKAMPRMGNFFSTLFALFWRMNRPIKGAVTFYSEKRKKTSLSHAVLKVPFVSSHISENL